MLIQDSPLPAIDSWQAIVHGDDSAPLTRAAFDMAEALAQGGPIVAVNATGLPLPHGLPRHLTLVNSRGAHTRSVAELATEIEDLSERTARVIVILGCDRLYRAARGVDRSIAKREALTPDQWDAIGESFLWIGEALRRRSIHCIWVTSSSAADTEVDGARAKVWRDLGHSVALRVEFVGPRAHVRRDVLEMFAGASSRQDLRNRALTVGALRRRRPRHTTSLAETTALEIEARALRAQAAEARRDALRDRYHTLAVLSAVQGPQAVERFMTDLRAEWPLLRPEDAQSVVAIMNAPEQRAALDLVGTCDAAREAAADTEHICERTRPRDIIGPDPLDDHAPEAARGLWPVDRESLQSYSTRVSAAASSLGFPSVFRGLAESLGLWERARLSVIVRRNVYAQDQDAMSDPAWGALPPALFQPAVARLASYAFAAAKAGHADAAPGDGQRARLTLVEPPERMFIEPDDLDHCTVLDATEGDAADEDDMGMVQHGAADR